jgi:hypothetical protein
MKTINRTYLRGSNPLSPEEIELERLARRYHEQCNAFDREACNEALRIGTMKAADALVKRIASHCKKRFRELTTEAKKMGFGKEQCEEAAHFVGVFIKNGL